ncbi:hypothetical protein [Chitinophaga solisilvae]|uniref:Uncharacterized protein n=1 Tax=Chitinophaga solisilvae TaxID=1233460 RepID=A0A9Q5D1Z1_9BACT|nr:hypothetical protein [Chitinophaga solisilvae]NSL86574.1 hypothetical protein [Chitinophaga solisilvae]
MPSRWVCWYIVSSLVFAVGADLIQRLMGNNMWFFSIMHLIQFVILSVFYLICIKNPRVRTLIRIIPFIAVLIFSIDLFKIEGVRAYNSITAGVKSIVLLVYGAIYFLQLLKDKDLIEQSVYIDTLPTFWYNSGLFIYFCTSFLFSISYNSLQALQTTGQAKLGMTVAILVINYVVGMITMILLYIGLLKTKRYRYADN